MAQLEQLPRPVMRRGAGFHANQAGRLFLEKRLHLTPPQLTSDDNATFGINTVDLKNILRKINTYRDNFIHGRLLFPRDSDEPPFWHTTMPLGGSRPRHQERNV